MECSVYGCQDVLSDPNNCGQCGWSCYEMAGAEGGCDGGVCTCRAGESELACDLLAKLGLKGDRPC